MSSALRSLGIKDKNDPSNYKRFKSHPKSDTTHILYRGDTRCPALIKQNKGFHPQAGKHGVSDSGGSTAMVCLTTDPNVAATYYAYVKNYFGDPDYGRKEKRGFVFACFLPSGRGILNYKMAESVGSKNAGSKEISALIVPWNHVVGWRELHAPDACKPGAKDYHLVDWFADFVANPDFNGDMSAVSREAAEIFVEFKGFTNVVVYNSKSL